MILRGEGFAQGVHTSTEGPKHVGVINQ